jgi:hypothetical protein
MEDFYLGASMSGGVRRKRTTRRKVGGARTGGARTGGARTGGARTGGARTGGCCPMCMQQRGGMKSPQEMMFNVLKHAEMGNITGGQVANMIVDYAGNGMYGEGFFGDLWSGMKKGFSTMANVAAPVLSLIPHPAAQIASHALGSLGSGRPRGRPRKRMIRRM